MDLECWCGVDDFVSTRLVVIGSRRLVILARRAFALDSAGSVLGGRHPMALAQSGIGPQRTAQDGNQVADKRLLCHAPAANEQSLGLDGRTTDTGAFPAHGLRSIFERIRCQHQ